MPSDQFGFEQQSSDTPQTGVRSSTTTQPGWNYESAVAQIEAIITRIETGELELADVFEEFAIAVEQLRQCETFLNSQKRQMDVLIETLLDEADPF